MNNNFYEINKQDRSYIAVKAISKNGAVNGFSRRIGGVSRGRISGFNFGFRVGDDPESVLKNYHLLAEDLGFDIRRAVCARQTHTANIRIVTSEDCGKGIFRVDSDIQDIDGLITNEKGIALIIFTADCVPLLFYDPVKKVVAASHAGWRGTAQNIGGKTVRLMCENFGSAPEDIIAAIGPSIGVCCFEVDEDTAANFDETYRVPKPNGKYHVDLWRANRDKIAAEGVKDIFISEECTICNSDKYYSYRTHKEHTGRQIAVIALND